jgi:hypothetical protein
MTDEPDQKLLDEEIAALLGPSIRRGRGRPRTGFAKALHYTEEVWEFRRRGLKVSAAVTKVAKQHGITAIHIYACMKTIADTDPREYLWEYDFTEPWE